MNIVFYSPLSLRNGGGAEQWQLAIAPALRDCGHVVTIITAQGGDRNLPQKTVTERLHGVSYHELPTRILPGGIIWLSKEARRKLAEYITQADAVHYVFGFIGHDWWISRMVQKEQKLYTGFHAPIFTHSRLHNWYVATISRWFTIGRSTAFFVFNVAQESLLRTWFPRIQSVSIAGGVDTARFAPSTTIKKSSTFHAVYVGRFAYEKGVDLLVEAVRQFLQNDPDANAQFTFVGAGTYEPQVRALTKQFPKNVQLHPFTPDVRPYIAAAHIAMLPSRQETFGLAMVEALAMGVPVLASGADGPRRVIQPGKTGWIVDPISASSYAKNLRMVYDQWSKDPAWKSWQAATRASAEKYSPTTIASRINEVINV